MTELQQAAQAVIDRWNTPLWKEAAPTAECIYRLRDALAAELASAALSAPAVPEAVADERKRLANRLRYETELEGFGCACSPSQQCATCKARDVLNKVLGPLIREFEAAPSPQEPTDV